MSLSINVAEHWTSSRRALVVTADRATVHTLVQKLELPRDAAVRVNQNRLAIALWGEDLKSYIRYRDDALNTAGDQTVPTPEYVSA